MVATPSRFFLWAEILHVFVCSAIEAYREKYLSAMNFITY
jgi:hypothetical protein